ncbi:flippase [Selenomonas ruminantium]|uniref:Membrane protein involved in the export of O-antigen and teichoic acid n=1 Tax=Selenomonas ruminantium TaxID=971 RepID=A0A1H0PPF9_SELRU|nr:flippase [Selenomonas ruminantium]SDP06459.1 Membrane protein involved in the export of O-antigen and teichoic acid [Selenomonas ruminantium]
MASNKMRSLKVNALLNAVTQLCKILFPVITFSYSAHILGASNIGILNFSASIVGYFSMLAMLGIGTYAVREGASCRNDADSLSRFASEVFSINVLSMVISYILMIILMISWDFLADYNIYIFIQSLAIIMATLGANWVNVIYEDFLYLTIRYISFQVLSIVLLLLFVKSREDLLVYILIKLFASSGGEFLNFYYIRRYLKLKLTVHLNLKKHLKPILILFANEVAVFIYVNSDITILKMFASDKDVGIYATASNLYNVTKRMVYSFIVVAMPRFSFMAANNTEKMEDLYMRIKNMELIVALPVTVGIILAGKEILSVLAGEEFTSGYMALCILSPAVLLVAYSNLCVLGVLLPYKQEKILLFVTCIASCVNIALNFLLIPQYGIEAAAFTTVIAELIVLIVCNYKAEKFIHASIKRRNVITVIGGTIGMIISCLLINNIQCNDLIMLILKIVISGIVYWGILSAIKNEYAILISKSIIEKMHR